MFIWEHDIGAKIEQDKVPNVRMKLCEVLPSLKRVVKLPKDQAALERLVWSMVPALTYLIMKASITAELTTDEDRDVQAAARVAQAKLATIEPIIDGVTKRDSPSDVEDRKREEEEKSMQLAEEAERDNDRRLGVRVGAAAVKPRGTIRDTIPMTRPSMPTRVDNRTPIKSSPTAPVPAPKPETGLATKPTQPTGKPSVKEGPSKTAAPGQSGARRHSRTTITTAKPTATNAVAPSMSPTAGMMHCVSQELTGQARGH